jgi:hypothetical protein
MNATEQIIATALEQLRGRGIDRGEIAETLVGFAVALYVEAHGGGYRTREVQLDAAAWLNQMANDAAEAAELRRSAKEVN